MNCLKLSGYNHEYRFTLLRGILQRKDQLEECFESGEKTRYRSRDQISSQKQSRLGKYPNTWFLKGDVGNTLKVPYTPSGKLKSLIDAKLRSKGLETADGCFTKVIEMAGNSISSGLKKSQNFGGDVGCHFASRCLISEEDDCRITRGIYKVSCLVCQEDPNSKDCLYIGTSARTLHSRCLEHRDAINSNSRTSKNPLAKHQVLMHTNDTPRFEMSVISGNIRYNLDRQISEALEIEHFKNDPSIQILNQRSEWGNTGLPRLRVTNQQFQTH